MARLNPNGTLDPTFVPAFYAVLTSVAIRTLSVQSDGKILGMGPIVSINEERGGSIFRANTDGSLDPTFNLDPSWGADSFAQQVDGRILIAGASFTALSGGSSESLARFHLDGTRDTTFNPRITTDNYRIATATLQQDGKILMGGEFSRLGGELRSRIGRLHNTGPASQFLTYGGSSIIWVREGTAPEIIRSTFDYSPDGAQWAPLGDGRRTQRGWILPEVSVPPQGYLRARGLVAGGQKASWFEELVVSAPWPIHVDILRDGPGLILSWTGGEGIYQVQQTATPSDPNSWSDAGNPSSTNRMTIPVGGQSTFLRVRRH
jgi:uncharacterized delta-60 repeat protein